MSATMRYLVPRQVRHVEIRLDDFDIEGIADYLRHHDYIVEVKAQAIEPDERLVIDEADLARIDTLLVCGQRAAAREMVLRLVSEHIGREL